jgi:hypothetical protein
MGRKEAVMTTNANEVRLCKLCNKVIPAARVKALPDTRLCIECSEEVGGEFVYSAALVSLAKEGSMKRNYGGVSVQKKRRKLPPR